MAINLQHPKERPVDFCIYALQICKTHVLSEHHLVEAGYEVCIEESSVEYSQAHNPADEFEVTEVIRIHARRRIDLKCVVVVSGILEQTVTWVKYFM